ncbi:M15 family metallopeptidase [Blastococcus haudaquaticus]|uniref:D-alanyl-D-alanine carboxypeptidase n=1 Tax=Blastococcus haudaquaticus TaxID=1938745 RepID=A0A286GQ54_9ACTN|nr:M15 family metallopeptidase [Blastococcus haudaquaticus]SOD97632.1 D-alanyl-D-alanine carboxypeptidase [Blastococcus haudaquaticus]
MSNTTQERTTTHHRRSTPVVVLAAAIAAIVGAILGYQAVTAPSSSTASPLVALGDTPGPHPPEARSTVPDAHGPPGAPGRAVPGGLTVDDGVVPAGVTVFDDGVPAVANLDPALLAALRQAARTAEDDGVRFTVNSGWRSPEYQEELLREAIAEYGSAEEAARWVSTPDTSTHVTGDGVDLGPAEATDWLSEHGAGYGLCQIYRNEPWHYELRPQAIDHGCPRMYADPTHDPRTQQ